MDNAFFVNSLSIGGAIFVGLVLVWFISVYLKRRVAPEQTTPLSGTPQTISWEEKRKQPRLAVSWQAFLDNSGEKMNVQIRDISLGGAFVVCPAPLALQEKFCITIDLQDQKKLQLNAEVVWSNVNVPEDKVIFRGMGIRFIDNTAEDREALVHAVTIAFEENER